MDALTLINKNLDVEKILNHYGFRNISYYGDYIRSCCEIHGGDNPTSFVISPETGLYFCHTNGCKGDVFTISMELDDVPFPQAVKNIAEILDIDIDNLLITERKNDYVKEVEKFKKYIKSKKKKEIKQYDIKAELLQVRKFRNFKEETLKRFELYLAHEIEVERKDKTCFKLYERLVIPIYEKEIQVGASLRKIRSKDNPKWFHIGKEIETGSILYNIDACKDYNEVIVCEGIFDVWSFYEAGFENAVCTFGAHLTEEQYRMLLRSGKDIVWCYDGDSAGLDATKKAISMMRYKTNQWVIHLPEGADPGNVTSETLKELYKGKERIL